MRARTRTVVVGLVAVVASVLLSGCVSPLSRAGEAAAFPLRVNDAGSAAGDSVTGVSVGQGSVGVEVRPGGQAVRPDAPVVVTARGGRLTSVTVTAGDGSTVAGSVDGAASSWRNEQPLAAGTDYQVRATVVGADGNPVTKEANFRTLSPKRTVTAQIVPGSGWTVGVGMPVVVDFPVAVTDRRAVERALTVASTPTVRGAWRWMTSRQIQWRPAEYWPTGTQVTVKAALGAVELAPGVWGGPTRTNTFRVGDAVISTVDIAKHTMTVRSNGKVIATIPVTTGKPGLETRNGIKVIMSRESSVRMDSTTVGIPANSPDAYNLVVRWAMRLTNSGEFVHAAPWSVASQGRANVSHGCTGVSDTWAKWMFEHSKVGDVVVHTGGSRRLEWGNGYTAWNLSFQQWSTGRG